jgi:hypothetical protein
MNTFLICLHGVWWLEVTKIGNSCVSKTVERHICTVGNLSSAVDWNGMKSTVLEHFMDGMPVTRDPCSNQVLSSCGNS